jgi:hypothetical protein
MVDTWLWKIRTLKKRGKSLFNSRRTKSDHHSCFPNNPDCGIFRKPSGFDIDKATKNYY